VQARDGSASFRSVDGAPQGRGLVGPAFGPGRLPAKAGGARDGERCADDGQRHRYGGASTRIARQAHERDEPDPREHAADGDGLEQVARHRGIAHCGPDHGGQRPGRRDEGQRGHRAIALAPPQRQRRHGADPDRQGGDRAGATQEPEPGGARALKRVRLAADPGLVERVQRIARPDPVRHDPQGDHAGDPERERPPAPVASCEIHRVGAEKRPDLGAREAGQRA